MLLLVSIGGLTPTSSPWLTVRSKEALKRQLVLLYLTFTMIRVSGYQLALDGQRTGNPYLIIVNVKKEGLARAVLPADWGTPAPT